MKNEDKVLCSRCGGEFPADECLNNLLGEWLCPDCQKNDPADDFEIQDGVLVKYKGAAKDVVVPEGVHTLGGGCFGESMLMETLTLPLSLQYVDSGIVYTDVYGYDYKLKRINVPSVAMWLNIMFEDDKGNLLQDGADLCVDGQLLEDLVVPGSIKCIRSYSFSEYKKLRSVVVEDGVEQIEACAFCRCGVETVTLPQSCKKLGGSDSRSLRFTDSPFDGCEKLNKINIPEGIETLPDGFLSGTAIEKITLPSTLKAIPNSCFDGCTKLKSIEIPPSVTSVGQRAFDGCDSLEELVFPPSVTSIGSLNARYLKRVILPDGLDFSKNKNWRFWLEGINDDLEMNAYDNALYIGSPNNPYMVLVKAKSKDIESCLIHEKCRYVCGYDDRSRPLGFRGCNKLTSIAFPKSIERIEDGALANCEALQSVELPPSYGTLSKGVYPGCPSLKFPEYGIEDKVVAFEKEAVLDDGSHESETLTIAKKRIDFSAKRVLPTGETILTKFKKANTILTEHLIDIHTLIRDLPEADEAAYRDDPDVYRVTYPINNKSTVTKYLRLNEKIICSAFSLVACFWGEYILINGSYRDTVRGIGCFSEDEVRMHIEYAYDDLSDEELIGLMNNARERGDFLTFEKVRLLFNKRKNGNEWGYEYGE